MEDLYNQLLKKKKGIYKLEQPIFNFFTHAKVYHSLFKKEVELFYETPPYKSVAKIISLLKQLNIDDEELLLNVAFTKDKWTKEWKSNDFYYRLVNDKGRITLTVQKL